MLNATGQQPQGLATVSVLSGMFTQTLGAWSLLLFGGAAFCILFSSVVAGFGGTGQALSLFLPSIDSRWTTGVLAIVTSAIVYTGSYRRLERTMMALVAGFTVAIMVAAIAMQFTEHQLALSDVLCGLQFDFPVAHLVLALAVYGSTGVNSAEIST